MYIIQRTLHYQINRLSNSVITLKDLGEVIPESNHTSALKEACKLLRKSSLKKMGYIVEDSLKTLKLSGQLAQGLLFLSAVLPYSSNNF